METIGRYSEPQKVGTWLLGSLILYLKGMRIVMFQLSGFYYSLPKSHDPPSS